MNLRIGRISQWLSPGFGYCYRCKTTWPWVKEHATGHGEVAAVCPDGSPMYSTGCFPLCEKCWSELTPETRKPYYHRLMNEWQKQGTEVTADLRREIIEAVEAGR